jgi:hypothetical protein
MRLTTLTGTALAALAFATPVAAVESPPTGTPPSLSRLPRTPARLDRTG